MKSSARRRRDRIETPERRQRFLASRIATYRADGNPSRDRAELAALGWAVQIIRAAEKSGLLDELEAVAVPVELLR